MESRYFPLSLLKMFSNSNFNEIISWNNFRSLYSKANKKSNELTTQEIKKHLMIFYYQKNSVTPFFQLLDESIGICSNHIDFFGVDDAFSIKVNRLQLDEADIIRDSYVFPDELDQNQHVFIAGGSHKHFRCTLLEVLSVD